ncbi:MAG: hypothetical protein KME27_12260 [Lyngbya sp. HA4199-MV5]|jgi:hypothetical protein|nr:hypothetical protein [Lyngbya sp. HA4199-MV5]
MDLLTAALGIASTELVKAGSGELGKSSVSGLFKLAQKLFSLIKEKLKGNVRAEVFVQELETQGNEPLLLEKVTKILDDEMSNDEAFAADVKQVAQQIVNFTGQKNTNVNYGRDQNINYGGDQNIINH